MLDRRDALKRVAAASALGWINPAFADDPLPGQVSKDPSPTDHRDGPLKDLNGDFSFEVPESIEAWEHQADEVRRQIRVALGLWPMPTKTPLEPVLHGVVERDGYTVGRVYFESFPGLYVTGSLYRPIDDPDTETLRPAILSPHGHWANGRFYDAGEKKVREQIAAGGEEFAIGGRHPIQARAVGLVRMGCVVFVYDMLGYADSVPIDYELAHRFARQRSADDQPGSWGLYSAQAELRSLNVMGLQTWNNIRALDFIESLPGVDTTRIGITGASGGGTQTMILSAIDDRIAAAFPAVMVSTAMQGGCTCENASHLRVNTGNIEFAALTAPRPLGLTAANDWTKELETKGLPELRELYRQYGKPENLEGKYFDFGHNYNAVSRKMMYAFFNKHFGLGVPEPDLERDYKPLSIEEATVWTEDHPKPPSGPDAERRVLRAFVQDWKKQLAELALDPKGFRKYVGGGWNAILHRSVPVRSDLKIKTEDIYPGGSYTVTTRILSEPQREEFVRVVTINGPGGFAGSPTTIWLTDTGSDGLFTDRGKNLVRDDVANLLNAGHTVVGVDLYRQPDVDADGKPRPIRRVQNPREFLGYTLGYNESLFAQRVHDAERVAVWFAGKTNNTPIRIIGEGRAATIAAVAFSRLPIPNRKLAALPGEFLFEQITDVFDPYLLPGAVKFGDIYGPIAVSSIPSAYLASPHALPNWFRLMESWRIKHNRFVHSPEGTVADAVTWLIKSER